MLTKRIFDILISSFLLIALSPLYALLAACVYLFLGSPIIFTQIRPGLHEKPFRMIKFRTMTNATDDAGNLLPEALRMNRFSKILRSTSLDELPEMWNVLMGQMSIVGPRPLLMDYLHFYNSFQKKRHKVKPGITGLAQVNGRNLLTWEEKFKLDVEYVNNQSFFLDLRICFQTVYAVLTRKGVNNQEAQIMERFKGSTSCETNLKNG